jgi:hypothetical protein
LIISGITLNLISPFTLSLSCIIKIRSKFIPKRVASTSLLKVPESVPRNRTREHYSMSNIMLISLCQLERGMNEYGARNVYSDMK